MATNGNAALGTNGHSHTEPSRSDAGLHQVVESLRQTFERGRTRTMSWRREQLRALVAMCKERETEIAEALRKDLGKSAYEAYLTEIGYVAYDAKHVLHNFEDWAAPEKVATNVANQLGKSTIIREPLGVVLIIAPWNYPFNLVFAPAAAAIAAGNCLLLKPSELAPHTSELVATLVPKYMDQEAIRVVTGGIRETQALLEEKFDHIFFTGGTNIGRIVMGAAAKHLTPVTLELGGKSPCIVDRSANLDVAARRILWAKFTNAGQTCVAPDYVLVDESIEEALTAKLTKYISRFWGADPQSSGDLGRIINDRHFQRLSGYLKDGDIVVGGQTNPETRYIAPTLLKNTSDDAPVMTEEIFGPILPIRRVRDVSEAIRFVRARPKPLALYLFSEDAETKRRVTDETSAGGMCINDAVAHFGVPDLPFGGVGDSGNGAYHGRWGFETFSHRKGVLSKATIVDPSVRYAPYNAEKFKWARRFLG